VDLHPRTNLASGLDEILNALELMEAGDHQDTPAFQVWIQSELIAIGPTESDGTAAVWNHGDVYSGVAANPSRQIVRNRHHRVSVTNDMSPRGQ
jgi:hypothetical protein